MIRRRAAATIALAFAAACAGGPPAPLEWKSGVYQCQFCRMTVIDRHFASQIVEASGEPRFFDDLGCLARGLAKAADRPDAVVYVADHRTGEWVLAHEAVYARVEALAAPMGSHVVAHASEGSRQADAPAAGGTPVAIADVLPAPWSGGYR